MIVVLSADTQKRADRLVGQVGCYLFLARERGHLDEAGHSTLQSVEEALLAYPPRVLLAAVAGWDQAGRPWRDPRPPFTRVMGAEVSKRPEHPGGARFGDSLAAKK